MKHNMNRVLSVVALLMLTVGTWARGGQVTTKVLPNENAGTVIASEAEAGKACTLTVTPASGYYLVKLEAVATLDGAALQAPQRRDLAIDNVVLEITPTNQYADPAGVTTHTLTIPTTDYNVEVTATFKKGDVIVGGKAVTDVNKNDVFGDGKVAFSTESNMLTLNGASIDMTEGYCPVESNIKVLNVMLIGDNVMTCGQETQAFSYTGDEQSATLTFTTDDSGTGTLTIAGGELANQYGVESNFPETGTGWYRLQAENSVKLYFREFYGLSIGDDQFASDKLTITLEDGGEATYNNVTKTLRLKNFVTTGNLTSTLSDGLSVIITGVNSVGTITGSGTLTISKNELSDAAYNKLSATSVSGFTVTTVKPLMEITAGQVYSDLKTYELWVSGTQVTDDNKDEVISGVSFDGDHTLTLTGVKPTSSSAPFITNGLGSLTIHLLGKNKVNCGEQMFLVKKDGDDDHQVTFTTNPNEAGKLILSNVSSSWYAGHNEPTYMNKLELVSSEDSVSIEAPSANYGLTIAGVEVTNLNAANIKGDDIIGGSVSFDVTTNTLTLHCTAIKGDITSGIETLIVNLRGASLMLGQFKKSGDGAKLVFVTHDPDGKLTMTAGYEDGLTVEYRNKLVLSGNVIALPHDYGISVNGNSITPGNHENVLGDGTVQFDCEQTLTLNGAAISNIVVSSNNLLPATGLKIILIGENTITNDQKYAVKYEKTSDSNIPLTITTMDGKDGKLVYVYSGTEDLSEADAFTNFSVTYDAGLDVEAVNTSTTKTVTVSTVLPPLTTEEKPVVNNTFAQTMASNSNTNNQVVNGVLITSGEDADNPETTGGYDQTTGKFTFVDGQDMTVEDIKKAVDEKIGSSAYAALFKGLTINLTAGIYNLGLEKVDLESLYDIYIQVGNQTPYSVRKLLNIETDEQKVTDKDVSFDVALGFGATVRIYLVKLGSSSSAPFRHIGPKSSVAGGLGGLTVKNSSMQMGSTPAPTYKSMELTAMAAAINSVGDALSGFTCSDPDITDLPDNMFISASNAPARRAGTISGTILPEGLTFVDFSNTKITGMEVSRTSGAFNGVPENVFIYMPAGNTTKEKNVVIGGICDMMELDGSDNAQPFKALKNFKAAQATLNRSFDAGERSTVCLPYSISQSDAEKMGTFYAFDKIESDEVNMNAVGSGLSANTPYIFKAASGGLSNLQVRVVDVVAGAAGGSEFRGVYERTNYGGQDNWYCFSDEGKFVKMKSGAYVPPFRAYFVASNTNAPVLSILWDGKEDTTVTEENTTAVETVKTVVDRKVAEGWWTINGMRLNAQPKKAGMYVFNGRLVVVK